MKRLSVILYVVLFLAVAGLYFLHFSGKNPAKMSETSSNAVSSPGQGIAYINIDTVIFKFNMFLDRRNDLMSKQKSAEAELNTKGGEYQKAAKDYQDKVNKGLITRATAAQIEQSLVQQQQELVSLRDKLQQNLVEEEQVMNRQVLEYITKFLEEHKSEYNYQYILGKSFGSVVLYGDNSLDITQKVLDAINNKYKGEKK
ncbi:MAG TPA: OmpH family outer membrane protein [Bacteroidales bacterium]|nr:OmpH family outer membrane protein [Bacteroidales bacterium]